jgi:hypothetical protein
MNVQYVNRWTGVESDLCHDLVNWSPAVSAAVWTEHR